MKVGLFIPCYINAIYPEVGIASYKLLKHAGIEVDYPLDQTCCGQPMANAGFEEEAGRLALRMEALFKSYDYIVGPSGSCVAFVKLYHPHILAKQQHVCLNSGKIYDICEFLHDQVKLENLPAPSELHIPYFSKLRDLLALVKGIEVVEPKRVDECCGFGGMYAIEEPEVSVCMGQDRVKDHLGTGAEFITGADSSCLMHMDGVIKREHFPIRTIHIVQILAAGL